MGHKLTQVTKTEKRHSQEPETTIQGMKKEAFFKDFDEFHNFGSRKTEGPTDQL